MPATRVTMLNVPTEWSFASGKAYRDPGNTVTVDVRFTAPDGSTQLVPCFWAGSNEWRVRFVPFQLGEYKWESVCSDADNPDLHGISGTLTAEPYYGKNQLYARGKLQIAADKRHMEFADGTPFFWLADTWWMGLSSRLHWPDEFQELTTLRASQGYTAIQIIAGLFPDMPAYDERGYNEAGHPWEPNYARLNPRYFDMADLRIRHMISNGLVPCIVAAWAYHLPWLGMDKMKLHWRNLIARWGAYPVLWCLAGEGAMPYYLSEDKAGDRQRQIDGWTEIGRYVRATDPFKRLVTMHPTDSGRSNVADPTILDFEFLQTGHGGWDSVPNIVKKVREGMAAEPKMPVINSEVNFEGILEGSREEIQRFDFWATVLLGAGFTYGANGLWQINRKEQLYGPSPHGASWGDTPWDEAARLKGGEQVALGKQFLMRYPWWEFEAHPEWIDGAATNEKPLAPYPAGIPGQLRLIYFPKPIFPWGSNPTRLRQLEQGVTYRAFWFNPRTGAEHQLDNISADAEGSAALPIPVVMQDWLLVLERIAG
ncbi:MAG: DUF4038 domain-containing protein [Chloroflexi bacterium]|nr:DUF4038 domain-containing protein [Chloroflexota bacterium]